MIKEVIIPHTLYVSLREKYLSRNNDFLEKKFIYSGIIRHYYERYKRPLEIDSEFIESEYNDYKYPKNFRQKSLYFLEYLYKNGGSEFKPFNLSCDDYPLLYANDTDEFQRIIEYLERKSLIEYVNEPDILEGDILRSVEFRLSLNSIEEIEKDKPVMPLWDLVRENVFTGNTNIDDKISHAKKLFFKNNSTLDDKRSACETLSYVLEPLRQNLKTIISDKDISSFFELVNNFDIRHNKEYTKQLQYEEQLEWVFYSLLNTIICYYKMINKK